MMYGRGYNGIGFNGNGFCNGLITRSNGWDIMIGLGVLITITLLIYLLAYNNKKRNLSKAIYEELKMKYVQGEITEEEYRRRKSVIDK